MIESVGADLQQLVDPVVVAAFGGWNDAGTSATSVLDHLAEVYDAELAYAIDPDDFYDYQVNRPVVSINPWGDPELTWPTTEIKVARLPNGSDAVLIQGLEPNLRWNQFIGVLGSALATIKPRKVYVLGALLADTPHTRPIPVSLSARSRKLSEEMGIERSDYEGPTGIVGVLADSLARAGHDVISMWAAIPHYVSHPPCPKATLALLTKLEDVLDTPLDQGELPELARAWERGVDELAAEDGEVAEYVNSLEEQSDATELPEASGDAIAAEFERYLRRRSD